MRHHVDQNGSPLQSLSSYRPPAGASPRTVSTVPGFAEADDILIASVFRNMRATLAMTEAELAARLSTSVHVVSALEAGAIRQLPGWPETARIVAGYGQLLQLDVQPALARLQLSMRRFSGPAPALQPAMPSSGLATAVPLPAPRPSPEPIRTAPPAIPRAPVPTPAEFYSQPSHSAPAIVASPEPAPDAPTLGERLGHKLAKLREFRPRVGGPNVRRAGFALAFIAVVMLALAALPARVTAKLEAISPAVAQSLRSNLDRWTSRTVAGDLQWVEVADPRSRKADKLPVAQP